MKISIFFKKIRVFHFFLIGCILGGISHTLLGARYSTPDKKSIDLTADYDFSSMLSLLKKHRSFTRRYHKDHTSFIKDRDNALQIEATLHKLYREYKNINNHLKKLKNRHTKEIARKKIQSITFYSQCLLTAIKDLEKISEMITTVNDRRRGPNPATKKAFVIIELDSTTIVQKLLQDQKAHII